MKEFEQIEELIKEAYNKLCEADEIIVDLVNKNKIPKHYANKIYNIILQLKNIIEE